MLNATIAAVKRRFDPHALAELTSEQWGLVTTRQAELAGVSAQQVARLAKTGTLERVQHGVYRAASSPPDRRDPIRAAWLALRPETPAADRLGEAEPGVLSHRSAAVAHALGDLEADIVEFTVPARRQTRSTSVRFHVRELDRDDWTLVDGLPVTRMLPTIGDLAAARLDSGHLAGVVRDALATHHLAFEEVAAVLRPYAHHYAVPLGDGSQMIERLLDEAGVPASTVRLGEYALNRSRQSGATLIDNSALNALVARALEPLLHSPAVEESVRRMQKTLGPAATAAFPNAVLRAITDHVMAMQSPALETLPRAIADSNSAGSAVDGIKPPDGSPAPCNVIAGGLEARGWIAVTPKEAKASKAKRSQAKTPASTP